jgi:glycosyltransferase involved in cell wall biosynthesis
MRVALIAPPFIEIPPRRYGGTELFLANLAIELDRQGHDVVVYANGESVLPCPVRWRYPRSEWPIDDPMRALLKNADHTAWAMQDAATWADVLHLNDVAGIALTRFVETPAVLTIHHTHEDALSEQYLRYPAVYYAAIARWLARREPMPHVHVIYHGLPLAGYTFAAEKDDYVAFLGRMAPCKAPHLAILAARQAGVRVKLAGEIQPVFRDYWEREVRPLVDGDRVEYVGEADHALKNALLSRARALLFPIQWEEPFGLVMIEAMACGTPVLALPGGAVEEVVAHGVTGWICRDVAELAARAAAPDIDPYACRDRVERVFSVERMADAYLELYEKAIFGAPHAAELEA